MTRASPETFHLQSLKPPTTAKRHFPHKLSYTTVPTPLHQRTKKSPSLRTRRVRPASSPSTKTSPSHPPHRPSPHTGRQRKRQSALLKPTSHFAADAATASDLPLKPRHPIPKPWINTADALEALSHVGLNDAFLFLRPYRGLSEGQKHVPKPRFGSVGEAFCN
jgi:hypothetical protein